MNEPQVTFSLDMPLEKAIAMNSTPPQSGDFNKTTTPYNLKNSAYGDWGGLKPLVEKHYFNYYQKYWNKPDTFKMAFELVQKLLERKMVKEPKTVKDFIELVNVFAEEIEQRM
ncbi:MAG: hypothetical protein KAS32_21860 [Candidatus Peribacteraceae bacterium]|nr:hypothetical protein [Candidatus Peribacteraceae bacterium]